MSKDNRTLVDFSNNLDSEFSWRRKELTLFKSKVSTFGANEQGAILRASLTMLYAHWEGFVKTSASHYLNYVSLRRLKLEELKSNYIALCIKSNFNFLDSNKFKLHNDAIEYLLTNMTNRAKVPYKSEIDTKSNLRFDVFTDICFLLGIDLAAYKIYARKIDTLVDKRNNVAHGRYAIIDSEDFNTYYNTMVDVITRFKNDLYDAAQSEYFKRAS